MPIGRSAILLIALFAAGSARAADLERGKEVFRRCAICHTLTQAGVNRVGPDLHGLFGRRAGSLSGFDYSAAMRNSGIVWNDRTLAQYLRNPRAFLPGNRMAFPGIKNDEDLDSLLLYLKQATQ